MRMRTENKKDVPVGRVVKDPLKVMVAGGMTGFGLTDLLIMEPKTRVNGEFYREHMINRLYAPAFQKTTGPDRLFSNLDHAVFMQDGATSHTANLTQDLCSLTFPAFWDKDFWPGNSPDLNPIENIWSIMEGKVYCPPLATNKNMLIEKNQ